MLLKPTDQIRVYLDAVPGVEPDIVSAWADHNATTHAFTPSSGKTAGDGRNPVVAIDSPPAGSVRQPKHLSIYNADAAAIIVNVEFYDGTEHYAPDPAPGMGYMLIRKSLDPKQSLIYSDSFGWVVWAP